MGLGHFLIVAAYLLAPPIGLTRGVVDARRRRPRRLLRWATTAVVGSVVGCSIVLMSAFAAGGKIVPTQLLVCGYFATAFVLILQGFDRLLWAAGRRVFRLKTVRPGGPGQWRGVACLVVRVGVVVCVGIPYVIAACVTFRPKVIEPSDPAREMKWPFTDVSFPSTDGTRLVGWWVPSEQPDADRTIVVCPDWFADKAAHLKLCDAVHGKYNLLVFDPRGRGGSGGQIGTFGDLERRDVLGAVRWSRANHPSACHRLMAIGVGTGAAAVIAAAAESSDDGQYIDAVAVVEPYGSVDRMARRLGDQFFPPVISTMIRAAGVPLASFQTGADLVHFKPDADVARISPRPVMVIHGVADGIYPIEEGVGVYESALEPKTHLWVPRSGYRQTIQSDDAAKAIRAFFDTAGRVV